MLEYPAYLVLGIGTEIGKTFLASSLCKKNPRIKAIKPVLSGFVDDNKSDSALLLNAMQMDINFSNLNSISPWRFEKPISPNFAGYVDYKKLLEFCKNKINLTIKSKTILLIEGAGGIMSPINNNKTFIDVAHDLDLPIILVTSNYLGSISHTLCALQLIKSKKLKLSKIILNNNNNPPISELEFINCINNFYNFEIQEIADFIKNS